jgi:hypothetical protein
METFMKSRILFTMLIALLGSYLAIADDGDKKENSEATKLFADARMARAMWTKFPGFTADITVTFNGKTQKGNIVVNEKGKVTINDLPEEMMSWTKDTMGSAVSHRISTIRDEAKTPCMFADEDANHPLGRLIQVVGDKSGSSFRIRDQQMMMVNRQMGDERFSITMLDNVRNEEGKFLPHAFVVHYWDNNGNLKKTESLFNSWMRQNGMDLPSTIRVITVDQKVDAKEIALANIKLQ